MATNQADNRFYREKANQEITVEDALNELRERFSYKCDIIFRTVGWIEIVIWKDTVIARKAFSTRRSTLTECMAQVREWKEQQG